MNDASSRPLPPHYWIVGVLSLIWNAYGGYDFVMKNMRVAAYVDRLPAELMQYLDELPVWAVGVWAAGVWGAVLGSLFLLLRSRFAVPAFAVSLIGLAVNGAYQLTSGMPAGAQPRGLTVAIWAVAICLAGYAAAMRGRGVLR
jgi:hypothetical protein